MSAPSELFGCPKTPLVVDVPGPQGAPGTPGADGAQGAQGPPGTPGTNITLPVDIASGGTGQTTAAAAFLALVAGSQLPIDSGGTGSATVSAAQTALMLGQDLLRYDSGAIPISGAGSIVLPTSINAIAGASLTIPSAGEYLILACVQIRWDNVIIVAAPKTLMFVLRKGVTNLSTKYGYSHFYTEGPGTGYPGSPSELAFTFSFPSSDFFIDPAQASCAAGDVIQLWGSIDTAPTVGQVMISGCSITAIPMRLTP